MVKIDFYGGVDEIGGNKILIGSDSTSFFLDFGMSFNKANDYFSEFLQPRKSNGIMDFIEMGLLPRIKGIYRRTISITQDSILQRNRLLKEYF